MAFTTVHNRCPLAGCENNRRSKLKYSQRLAARANLELTETRYLQEESQQNGAPRASLYQQQVLQLTRLIRTIDQANKKLTLRRQT